MAAKKSAAETALDAPQLEHSEKAPELFTIGELQKRKKITPGVFAGACSVNGWRHGKMLSEDEFMEGVRKFTNAPMSTGNEVEK